MASSQAMVRLTPMRVGAIYVGTVVGAGFASGQEVARFFTHFGVRGAWGLLGATVLFAFFGIVVLTLGRRVGATSHRSLLDAVAGPGLGRFLDATITFFLFGGLAVMVAGSGAIFHEELHLPHLAGAALMALVTGVTVWTGFRGVVHSISLVAPVLVVSVLFVGLLTFTADPPTPADLAWWRPDLAAFSSWPVTALLYVSFNMMLATAILAPLGRHLDDNALRWGGLAGGVTLGLAALVIHLALMAGLPTVADYEVPMLYLARRIGTAFGLVYSVILWAEVYTTAVGSLYGLVARVAGEQPALQRLVVLGGTALALVASGFGFSRLVLVLFPLVGWIGLLLLAALVRAWWLEFRAGLP